MKVMHDKLIEVMDMADKLREDGMRIRTEIESNKVGSASMSFMDDTSSA